MLDVTKLWLACVAALACVGATDANRAKPKPATMLTVVICVPQDGPRTCGPFVKVTAANLKKKAGDGSGNVEAAWPPKTEHAGKVIIKSPSGTVTCPKNCSPKVTAGTSLTFTVVPDTGDPYNLFKFDRWGVGVCEHQQQQCKVTVDPTAKKPRVAAILAPYVEPPTRR
jgi:hypothetical protein